MSGVGGFATFSVGGFSSVNWNREDGMIHRDGLETVVLLS